VPVPIQVTALPEFVGVDVADAGDSWAATVHDGAVLSTVTEVLTSSALASGVFISYMALKPSNKIATVVPIVAKIVVFPSLRCTSKNELRHVRAAFASTLWRYRDIL
jgi:hypothetical protein